MLYVTTRNRQEAFTVQHVLTENWAADGGLYLPLHFPKLSSGELDQLKNTSFNQRIAELLNVFFGTKLSGWDVDFSAGRYPVRTEYLPHRILMAETWHNPRWHYEYMDEKLTELLSARTGSSGNWVSIAIRMAILAAILLDQQENGEGCTDISCVTHDFSLPISAWYLREVGLPVGNIICCSNENDPIWDLICLGQMRVDTCPPVNLERLISDCGGAAETESYLKCVESEKVYSASDTMLKKLRHGLYVSVVSSGRIENTIPNVYRTYNYVLQPESALAYSGLMDYRAKTGITRTAIVLCDESPICKAEMLAECMHLSKEEILRII